jgi:hypothetical protein
MSFDNSDWYRTVNPGQDLGSYSTIVSWNHMAVNDWVVAAADAHDSNWGVTKAIAWNSSAPEAIKFVYCDGSLRAVLYCMAENRCCGWGYKGHGMTGAEQSLIEQFFFEVDDADASYAYKRRTSQPT